VFYSILGSLFFADSKHRPETKNENSWREARKRDMKKSESIGEMTIGAGLHSTFLFFLVIFSVSFDI
jgi:hypothetical protein